MDETRSQSGFSLIELLVAMLVTMIVSGAIFTLLNAGQGAFRREPELTDRQQNIRLAMDMIQRDIATAGAGMDPFEQAFTAGDGIGETPPALNAVGPGTGPSSELWDILEVKGADGSCSDVPVAVQPPNGNVITTAFNLPDCFPAVPDPLAPPTVGLVAVGFGPGLADRALWGLTGPNPGPTVQFVGAQPAKSEYPPGGVWPGQVTRVMPMQIARYAIALDAAQVPSLWRSGRGGLDAAGALTPPGDPTGDWQLIARGIEDLQVRYRHANDPAFGAANCCGVPLNVVPGNFATIVREVEVTLWARTFAPSLQGQTTGPNNNVVAAIRGSLVTVTTPRAALQALLGVPVGTGFEWR